MSAHPAPSKKKEDLRQQMERLVNEQPAVCTGLIYGALLLTGYLLVYDPGTANLAGAKRAFKDKIDRAALIEEASSLDTSVDSQRGRMPEFISEYAWMETFLNAARSSNVRLESLTPTFQKQSWLGRGVEVGVSVNLTGAYGDVLAFIRWVEADRPFYRICELTILPAQAGTVAASLAISILQREAEKQAS